MKTTVFFLIGAMVGVTLMTSFNSRKNNTIEVVSYNPLWPQIYESEVTAIKKVLDGNCLVTHHFGSTSVPGLSAKPKIDILAVVKNFSSIDISALERLGFKYRGEVIPSGRYLAKEDPKVHLHIFKEGNPLIERNLIFRDWLRTHNADRDAYARLKQELASQHTDGMEYCRAKTEFINEVVEKAINKQKDTRFLKNLQ